MSDLTSGNVGDIMEIAFELLYHFQDKKKAILWMKVSNPELNHMRPMDMVLCGQSERLLKIINRALKHD